PRLAVGELHVGAVVGADDAVRNDADDDEDADPSEQDDATAADASAGDAVEHGGVVLLVEMFSQLLSVETAPLGGTHRSLCERSAGDRGRASATGNTCE